VVPYNEPTHQQTTFTIEVKEPNMKRLHSIDVLRGLAILSMVLVHFVGNLAPYEPRYATWLDLIYVFGSFAAPTFTFLVGLSFQLSLQKQQSQGQPLNEIMQRSMKRGIAVFIVGLIFAVIIWTFPEIFGWDILTLIGAALLILYPIRKLSPRALIGLCVVILVISPLLREITSYASHWLQADEYVYDFTFQDTVLGFLVNGHFPLFPWLIFPLVGMALGKWLEKVSDWRIPVIGVILLILAGLGVNANSSVTGSWGYYAAPNEFYPASTTFILEILGVILILFWILYRWLDGEPREPGPVLNFFRRYSRFSLTVYVLHHAVHVWPLYIAAKIQGRDIWYYHQDAVNAPVALVLTLIFMAGFYALIFWWEKRGGKYSLEWMLAKVTH
jgi:uncharacterized membrane protein